LQFESRDVTAIGGETGGMEMKTIKATVMAGSRGLSQERVRPQSEDPEEIAAVHENEIPPFVGAELERLYGHMNSSLTYLAVSGKAEGASTYVARRGGQPVTVLLFKRERKGTVRVINEMSKLSPGEIARFAKWIFSTYKSVTMISFSMLDSEVRRLPYPFQLHGFSEDIVVGLPPTPAEYLESLSQKTRKNTAGQLKKLKRDAPSFQFRIYEKDEISAQQIRDIVSLSKARIGGKNLKYATTEAEVERLIRIAQERGFAGIATIDGKICAGVVNSEVGGNYFGHVLAHDPELNKYSLGMLCCYLTMCEEILRGAQEHHFGWGRYEYKYKLGGVQRDMVSLDVYRSSLRYVLNSAEVARNAVQTYVRQIKFRLLDIEREESANPGPISRFVKALRKVKRSRLAV
jgi:CelD/BcsL family acetyltransferase involved in cellulose biosynthesis